MARRAIALVLGVMALVVVTGVPTAAGDGLPVPAVTTPSNGVPGPHGAHYMTSSHEGRTTVRAFGPGADSKTIPGRFAVPAVTLDGSPSGLSGDGSTLALIEPRRSFPQSSTQVLILDTDRLRTLDRLVLHGDFSFDAISPDGSRLYFIEYLSRRDPTRYAVRAYDVERRRMLPDPIVDPNEKAGEMRGYPMTRVTSTDGRWAYTLYDGGGSEPFVHALDTAAEQAVCVDLDGLVKPQVVSRVQMRMSANGGKLELATPNRVAAVIDTETLEASKPSVARPSSEHGSGGGFPWVLVVAVAVAALAGTAVVALLRRRRAPRMAAPDA